MKKLLSLWFLIPIAALGFVVLLALSLKLYDRLSTLELFTVLAFPLILGVGLSLITDRSTKSALVQIENRVSTSLENALNELSQNRIIWHGTKFNVPESTLFWNQLLERAQTRFYLVGRTNKSWVDKDDEQSRRLAENIIRILQSNGTVRIVSADESEIVARTVDFLDRYVNKALQMRDSAIRRTIASHSAQHLTYTVANSNYGAVISDDRLFLIPTLNSSAFRADSPVFEIDRSQHRQVFDSLLADIERLAKSGTIRRAGFS